MKYGSLSKQPVFHGIRKGPQVFCLYRGSIDFLGILHPRTPRLCVRFHADSGPPQQWCYIPRDIYHGPPKPVCLEVFMVNNLVFRWPKTFIFHGFWGPCIFVMIVWWVPTIFHVKVWNHPTETTFKNGCFGVPGMYIRSIYIYLYIHTP